jgi:Rieske Fe-S protein
LERRKFIQSSCLLIAGSCFLFNACKTENITESNGEIKIPVSKLNKKEYIIINSGNDKIILLKKDNYYLAYLMRCTHKGATLEVTGNHLVCPAHGSIFGFDGQVITPPAKLPLKSFPVKQFGDELFIQLA